VSEPGGTAPAAKRGHGRRIVALFRPHRGRLGAVLGLILVSALLGMISPFLLREVLDHAIPEKDKELLAWLVGGMIVISVITGVLGVGQTWLSNLVGQRVMHDLRSQVYRHLQRLSLAFFTRTRTGEIQSRIANDIGGVQTVVTTTATSIVSNVTTVVASVVAMFLLDWRLAIFSLGLLPFFVLLARRVGNQRRKITTVKQGAMADISSLVQESLSVSGILLGKTMGRGAELADRFEGESARLADLEVPLAHGRALDDGVDPDVFRRHARARLPVRRPQPQRGVDRHRGRLHDASDPAVLAHAVAAQRRRGHPDLHGALRSGVRVPRPAGRHPPRHGRAGRRRG
jgi:ABC-type bacteriocin/lantibiotic exporter with double-glycine peptidase domain